MKLADFKRQCTIGAIVECTHAKLGSLGIRQISKVQSNMIAFRTNQGLDSWLAFPKASEIKYDPELDVWNIYQKDKLLLTYKFIKND